MQTSWLCSLCTATYTTAERADTTDGNVLPTVASHKSSVSLTGSTSHSSVLTQPGPSPPSSPRPKEVNIPSHTCTCVYLPIHLGFLPLTIILWRALKFNHPCGVIHVGYLLHKYKCMWEIRPKSMMWHYRLYLFHDVWQVKEHDVRKWLTQSSGRVCMYSMYVPTCIYIPVSIYSMYMYNTGLKIR